LPDSARKETFWPVSSRKRKRSRRSSREISETRCSGSIAAIRSAIASASAGVAWRIVTSSTNWILLGLVSRPNEPQSLQRQLLIDRRDRARVRRDQLREPAGGDDRRLVGAELGADAV